MPVICEVMDQFVNLVCLTGFVFAEYKPFKLFETALLTLGFVLDKHMISLGLDDDNKIIPLPPTPCHHQRPWLLVAFAYILASVARLLSPHLASSVASFHASHLLATFNCWGH
jgi:hypothetical protein